MTETTPIPSGYAAVLAELKQQVRNARFSAQRRVNTELVRLYWGIGTTILQRQETEGWGSNVIGRLATDLRAEFPDMKGFSRANLFYMRRLAGEWPADAIVQQAVGQLPWGHITVLLDRLDDHHLRDWYAHAAATHGWSRNVLDHQIKTSAHTRLQAAPSNFSATLPAGDSDLAQQLTKDPYVLDFLALDGDAKERHLDQPEPLQYAADLGVGVSSFFAVLRRILPFRQSRGRVTTGRLACTFPGAADPS